MTEISALPNNINQVIDIGQLAEELGVENKYFTYSEEDMGKARNAFNFFQESLQISDSDDNDADVQLSTENLQKFTDLLGSIGDFTYLPLFFPKITTENIPSWQKFFFLDLIIAYIITRWMELRREVLKKLKDEDTFAKHPRLTITPINSLEILNTFGSIFLKHATKILHQQPTYKRIKNELLELESWYDKQMDMVQKNEIQKKLLEMADRKFWANTDLPVAKLFISNSAIRKMEPSEFVRYIDRFLCHADKEYFGLIVGGIIPERSGFLERWSAWILAKKNLLISDNITETQKIFGKIFELTEKIIDNGFLSKEAREKLPKSLIKSFEDIIEGKKRDENRRKKILDVLSKKQLVAQGTSITLIQTAEPAKIFLEIPEKSSMFIKNSEGDKPQLKSLNLMSLNDLPVGTRVTFTRTLPKAKTPETIDVTVGQDNPIEPVLGQSIHGIFAYCLTIILPSTHVFAGQGQRLELKESFYAKAEPTEAEKEANKRRLESLKDSQASASPVVSVVTLVPAVADKVEKAIDKIGVSLTATAIVFGERVDQYTQREDYDGGDIVITISDEDRASVLGLEAETLLSEHRTWTIHQDNSITPDIQDVDVKNALYAIALILRQKSQAKIQEKQNAEQRQKDDAEYEEVRHQFVPLLDFARGFQLGGNENGEFEAQKAKLHAEMRVFGWSISSSMSGGVIWRHTGAHIKIFYTTKICTTFEVRAEEKGHLTPAIEKCYAEIAEAFAHIARFMNAEARERKKMVKLENSLRKERETGAVAYDKLLIKGQARLVLLGPYQQNHGVWSSKFPTETTPYMLNERASYQNIEQLLKRYPHAELCYRRDLLCINGEMADDASAESVENTSNNIIDLLHSPRARYILRKRILITLKLQKYTDETDRAPINQEKNKKTEGISALDILLTLKIEKKIKNAFDIDKDFVTEYIKRLDTHKIRVHYVWPLSARLNEHKKYIRK